MASSSLPPSLSPASIPPITPISHRHLRLAAAGALAGMFTNTVLHPLDTIKTLRQTHPSVYRGVVPAFKTILQKRGPLALYAGIAPALVGSALSSALYFGVYEVAKAQLQNIWPAEFGMVRWRMPLTAVAASCGNVASSVLFVPKEVVKQRMQAGLEGGRFFAAAVAVVRTSGMGGLYRGYKATLLRNVPSTMIRFALYEEMKILMGRVSGGKRLKEWQFVLAGAVSGAISSACTTPFDVLKTRLATGKIKEGTGVWRALTDVIKKEGVLGLYVGVRPRIIWAALFAAIGFSSYEICKMWMLGFKGRKSVDMAAGKQFAMRGRGKFQRVTAIGRGYGAGRSALCTRRIRGTLDCDEGRMT